MPYHHIITSQGSHLSDWSYSNPGGLRWSQVLKKGEEERRKWVSGHIFEWKNIFKTDDTPESRWIGILSSRISEHRLRPEVFFLKKWLDFEASFEKRVFGASFEAKNYFFFFEKLLGFEVLFVKFSSILNIRISEYRLEKAGFRSVVLTRKSSSFDEKREFWTEYQNPKFSDYCSFNVCTNVVFAD